MQGFQDVVGITGRCSQAGMLKAIDTDSESTPNLFRAMCVRDDRKFVRMRFIDDGLHFVHRHLVLVD
jgi:hypothetical protein